MEFVSTQKFIHVSPRKLRLVVNLVKKFNPTLAQNVLKHTNKSAAIPLNKALTTAVANAKDQGIESDQLVIKEIQIAEGPRLRRGRAGARGVWKPMKKRMSHIRIVLEQQPKPEKPKKTVSAKQKVSVKQKKSKKGDN